MRIIDLSHTIANGMPGYPGTPPPALTPAATIGKEGYAELRLTLHSHTGTHLDAPAHLLAGGRSLDQFPLAAFHGPALLLDLRQLPGPAITLDQLLARREEIDGCEFILLHTGWSRYWGEERYYSGYPVLTPEATAWLAQLPLKGIGLDTLSLDPLDSPALPNHRALMAREILIVENLTNLAALPPTRVIFSCLPLKIAQADGAPTRAAAFCPPVPGKTGSIF